jgi:small subunit ribosomal protein S8
MTMTDPIADMLTRLRNGNVGYHDYVVMPSSKIKVEIAKVLKQEGYVSDYEVQEAPVGKVLRIELKYGPNRERTISGVRRISRPGLRHYVMKEELPRVLGGLGIAIISTSTGLLTDRAAHKAGIGGEVLAYVW